MEKIILLIEDDKMGQKLGKRNILEAGFKVVIADNLEDAKKMLEKVSVSGIITDIHFPQRPKGEVFKPSGIAVVAKAIELKIPVVICSSLGHEADYLRDAVRSLEIISGTKIPFAGKDFKKATEEIKNILKEE